MNWIRLFFLIFLSTSPAFGDFRRQWDDEVYPWKINEEETNWRQTPENLFAEYLRKLRNKAESRFEEDLPLARDRPDKQFTYATKLDIEPMAFAVPPSDSKFFDPPPTHRVPQNKETKAYDEPKKVPLIPGYLEQNTDVVRAKISGFDALSRENIILTAMVAGTSSAVLAAAALIICGCMRLHKKAQDAADVEYPAYGVTGPNKESTPTGDRRLAHSAQVYHYQLTKQQIIAMESTRGGERRGSISEADSDDDNEEGDYTVYECPGLAPTGEMEVKNPLFQDEPTPAAKGSDESDKSEHKES